MKKVDIKKYNVKNYYIAYFDVLGYQGTFEDKESDIIDFLRSIVRMFNEIINSTTTDERIFQEKFEVKTFSDNCIIMLKGDEKDEYQVVKSLSYLLAVLQFKFLLEYNILIRGAITRGEAYINENIVFGEGLIRAVNLEEKTAIYPRIVIDSERISKPTCVALCEKCIFAVDDDEKQYVDFFNIIGTGIGGCDDFLDEDYCCKTLKVNIEKLIKKHGRYAKNIKDQNKIYQNERKAEKHLWLLLKYNDFCKFNLFNKYEINFQYVINRRIMKCEIIVE